MYVYSASIYVCIRVPTYVYIWTHIYILYTCMCIGFAETSSEGAALGCIGLAISDGYDFKRWKRLGEN